MTHRKMGTATRISKNKERKKERKKKQVQNQSLLKNIYHKNGKSTSQGRIAKI